MGKWLLKRENPAEALFRRAASIRFDPVLVTSWSPSHRGGLQCSTSLDGGLADIVQAREVVGEVVVALGFDLSRVGSLAAAGRHLAVAVVEGVDDVHAVGHFADR